MTPRFHLDENLTTKIAEALRKRDRDCSTCQAAGLIGATDAQQWAFAVRESRVIITSDQDFLRLAVEDNQHPGIIYWTKHAKCHFGQLVKAIDELCFQRTADEMRGTVTYL